MKHITEQPVTIAIADDHQLWHEQLNISLPEFGLEIIINAFDGQELLDKLAQLPTLPDVCLLDINMPIMDGFETATRLKTLYPQIKILAFSMEDDAPTITAIKKAGADGFIWKCCKLEELTDRLFEVQQIS